MVDWLAIKTEYVTSQSSYRKLAEKYGINKDTIAKRAKSEGWKQERQTQTDSIQTKAIQKTVEKISDAQSDVAAIKEHMRLKWWQRQEKALDRLIAEEATGERDIGTARQEMQNYIDLLSVEPDAGTEMPESISEARKSFREFMEGLSAK